MARDRMPADLDSQRLPTLFYQRDFKSQAVMQRVIVPPENSADGTANPARKSGFMVASAKIAKMKSSKGGKA